MTRRRLFEDLMVVLAVGAFITIVWAADSLAFHP